MSEDLLKLKAERDDYKARFEELKIKQDIAAIIETLPSRYDRNRVKGLVDDSLEVFTLDSRENIVTRSGKPAKDWIMATIETRRERDAENIISAPSILGMVPSSSRYIMTRFGSLPSYSSATASISL